jgi:hypothetical protein
MITNTAHNGIAALKIPLKFCGTPITLEMLNPLSQDVVYTTIISKPIAARVMEVALTIPFQGTQKETKAGNSKNPIDQLLDDYSVQDQVEDISTNKFSRYRDFYSGAEQIFDSLCSNGQEDVCDALEAKFTLIDDAGNITRSAPLAHTNGHRRVEKSLAIIDYSKYEFEYNPITDILKMDRYTVECNLDEVATYRNSINELNAESDPNPKVVREALNRLDAYLGYLSQYFESRIAEEELQDEKASLMGTEDFYGVS